MLLFIESYFSLDGKTNLFHIVEALALKFDITYDIFESFFVVDFTRIHGIILLNIICHDVYLSKTSWNCIFPPLVFFRINSVFGFSAPLLYIFSKKVIFSKFSGLRLEYQFCCLWN